MEAMVSRAACPDVEGGVAASGPLESGSGLISFSPSPPRTTFVLSMDMAGHSEFTLAQFRSCLASLIFKSESWEKNPIDEPGSHVYVLI